MLWFKFGGRKKSKSLSLFCAPQNCFKLNNLALTKKEITNLQKFAISEKKELNLSFQLIQKKLRDVLASVIKTISKDKKIDLVVLKENIFLINNFDLDLTNEALKEFDKKTSNLKIQFVRKKGKKIE